MPEARRRTLAVSTALLTLLGTAAPALAATAPTLVQAPLAHHGGGLLHSTSGNWAGYAATGGKFTSVSASWVQPAVTCSGTNTWSSFWVGLDGDGSNTVEQTGTEADCSSGRPVYSAWYEMYPQYPSNFSSTVRPGDHFTASVTTNGSGSFTLTLSDTTAGWSHTVNKSLKSAALASAEVIAEAPSSSSGVLPLSDFGSVSFSGSTVNGQALGGFSPDNITMASGGTTKATTSSLSGGSSFSVTWKHS
ncbi:G1 family glutamic endopeptidase [Kitasatospora cathayae]|uniref:G1 family endopeptidase n=1 Tax=Kitasatospora cathayae TaxID=3004092 RepID=A0ABY7PYC2_9ACTN|nr:G1 family glutamic endopeptidase [Kitasatospora sp. HUAS 3-15]WBP85209.1 G1 family endopeptidase [Kitasatospora sp. HUAS 3-15]